MQVDGKCHCGKITYRAEVDPERAGICHCTDCQMLTGSAYRVSLPAPAQTFRLLTGQPKEYVKTAESGVRRAHAFCPECGTPVYATAELPAERKAYSLRIGCLRQRAALAPRRQIWCQSALPWSGSLAGVPQVERQ